MYAFLSRLTGIEEDQIKPALLAALYIFCVMTGYFIIRPIRDDIGLLVGKDYLPRLFLWVLLVMIIANPIFSYLMNRFSRVSFIKFVYRFFALNILAFIGLFKYLENAGLMPKDGEAFQVTGLAFGVGVAFFLWVSVFNLFAVSIFWALMSDLYSSSDSKKLFGFVGAGATFGQLIGSSLTKLLVSYFGPTNLLFLSIVLLEVAVFAMTRLTADYQEPERKKGEKKPNALSGVSGILKSPYLLGICAYIFLFTFTSTFLWFQKQYIVDAALSDRGSRVDFFATIPMVISTLTLVIQLFLTGRLLPVIGLSAGLSLVPFITGIGFLIIAWKPTLWTIAIFEICRSTANYGISRPSREILYTAVTRQERYLSKSFIDTFVYRGGDAVASGAFEYVKTFAKTLSVFSLVVLPFTVVYAIVAIFLGKTHAKKIAAKAESEKSS